MLLRLVFAVSMLFAFMGVVQAKRVALVIGNSEYSTFAKLDNPVNDARLMEKALRDSGFEVTVVLNADQARMKKAMLEFGRTLRKGVDASLFYYAGHGVQVNGENFLIPVEADLEHEDEVAAQTIDVNDFLQTMKSAKSPFNIIVLDACRNNPLNSGRSAGGGGLAPVNAPKGSFIAYATSPGKIAADGEGKKNSPYTSALAEALNKPGLKLEDVFKKAREKVLESTDGEQLPWEASSITGDFHFRNSSLKGDLDTSQNEATEDSIVDGTNETISGVSVCKRNDKRIRIQKWTPSFKSSGSLEQEPPMGEGVLVFIKTAMDASEVDCGARDSDIFSLEHLNGDDRQLGGLKVNFPSSSVRQVRGLCHISGFFMNKDVPGMHFGFTQTYFEPVDLQKIVLSGNFCMKQ